MISSRNEHIAGASHLQHGAPERLHMTDTSPDKALDFTPAFPLRWAYDPIVSTLTREARWRQSLLRQVNPGPRDVIADVGCGTASFLALLGCHSSPPERLIGIDPDAEILARAREKLVAADVLVTLELGYLRDVATKLSGSGVNKIVSSLVFHQVPLAEKRAGLRAIFDALPEGGELHIADYGLQRTVLMRTCFRLVQLFDGKEDTQPNADGLLPRLMEEAGFERVEETDVVPTLTGSFSLYRAVKPPQCVGSGVVR